MGKTRTLTITAVVDDDATDEQLIAWLTIVLPLRGDTGQIQEVETIVCTDPDQARQDAVLVSDRNEPVEVRLLGDNVFLAGRDGSVTVDIDALFDNRDKPVVRT